MLIPCDNRIWQIWVLARVQVYASVKESQVI